MSRKKITLTKIKEIGPQLAEKEINIKAIILESNAKEDIALSAPEISVSSPVASMVAGNAGNTANATLLVGDETGCISLVIPQNFAVHLRVGDIIQFHQVVVVMKKMRIFLWNASGKFERVGEFTMLFKEAYNVSNITWMKDPKNNEIWISNRTPLKRPKPV